MIPKQHRDHIGLPPGEAEVTAEGTGLPVEPPAEETLDERDGRPVVPANGAHVDDDLVRSLRGTA